MSLTFPPEHDSSQSCFQAFVECMTLANFMMNAAEDGGSELRLYPQSNALALQRSC